MWQAFLTRLWKRRGTVWGIFGTWRFGALSVNDVLRGFTALRGKLLAQPNGGAMAANCRSWLLA